LSEKFRRFVILVSIQSGWIHLSTLSEFAGPLHSPAGHNSSVIMTVFLFPYHALEILW